MGCLTAITYCARVCVCTGSVLPLLLSFTLTVSPAASAYQAEKVQEKAQSQVNTYSEVGKQGQLCASPSTYRCVPHRPHTVVCLTVHIPLCASPSTYRCVPLRPHTYLCLSVHIPLCASPSTYLPVPLRPHTVVCLSVHIPACASPSKYYS